MKIGFLGLGAMGSRMADRLIGVGHDVTVWNRSPGARQSFAERGVAIAATPAEAADGAALVMSMVRDDEASKQVWTAPSTGALHRLGEGAVAVESSTITPEWTRDLAQQITGIGRQFVACPVAGTLPQVEAGQLILLAGGPEPAISQIAEALGALGKLVPLRSPNDAALAKLCVNTLLAAQVVAVAELRIALARLGMQPDEILEPALATPVCSPAMRAAATSMSKGAFVPALFPVELMSKDMGYAADEFGREASMVQFLQRLFGAANDAGLGAEQMSAVVKVQPWPE